MNKHHVVEQIREYLTQELDEESRRAPAEESERARELKGLLLMYRFMPTREYGPEEVIVPSTLVELQLGSTIAYYYVAPQGGGLVTRVDGQAVQVITPQSPLGEALLGKKAGDQVKVEIRGAIREYRILSIS